MSRVALVTGATRGIGLETVRQLIAAGFRVVGSARSIPGAMDVTGAVWKASDAGVADQVEELVAFVDAEYGRLDVVVHAAGIAPAAPIREMSPGTWDAALATNLSGAFYLAHFAWPLLARADDGVIVMLGSLAGRTPWPGFGAYGPAKAGLELFGVVAGREGHPDGIRAHTLVLGAVETDLLRAVQSPEALPPERVLSPGDVAATVMAIIDGPLRYTSGEAITLRHSPGG